jgi:uncharacterized protein
MAQITVRDDTISLDEPVLVEGLPGVGLVGKLAADHLVETFDMEYYAACYCEGLPRVAVYDSEDSHARPPVRLYADAERDLVVLQSDVPVSPADASEFAGCVTGWLTQQDALPIYLSGIPVEEKTGVGELYGLATGAAGGLLDEHGIVPPPQGGVVQGPTGALVHEAERTDLDSLALVTESMPNFPDPEAAKVILEHGIAPVAGIEVDTDRLVEHADEIQEARERMAQQMQEAGEESSRAQPRGMFQ